MAYQRKKIYRQENATKDLTGRKDCHFKIQEHDRGVFLRVKSQCSASNTLWNFQKLFLVLTTTAKQLHLHNFLT